MRHLNLFNLFNPNLYKRLYVQGIVVVLFLSSQSVFAQEIAVQQKTASTASSVEDLLRGRIAGVQVVSTDGAPGSAIDVRIRGVRSLRGDNQPLYILDGVILNPTRSDAAKTFWHDEEDYQTLQNTLNAINPNDIAKIEVLKEGAATAIYGSMGGNGVIIMTSRSGKLGDALVDFKANFGFTVMNRKKSVLGKTDYQEYVNSANPNIELPFTTIGDQKNWQDEVSRIGFTHNYYVSVSGASNNMNYLVSAGLNDTQGVVDRTDLQQTTIRVNVDRKIGKNGVIGTHTTMGYRVNNMQQTTTPVGSSSLTKQMHAALPFSTEWSEFSPMAENTRSWVDGYDDNSIEYSVIPTIYFKAQLAPSFMFNVNAGLDYRNKSRLRWLGSDTFRGYSVNGSAGKSDMVIMKHNVDAQLTYNKNISNHTISALLGTSLNGDTHTNRVHEGTTFFNEDLRGKGIRLAENVYPYQNIENKYTMLSAYANVNYTYNDIVSLGMTMRTDKTFRYDKGSDGMVYYPGVYASWNVLPDRFKASQNILSDVKLRASWGKSGKQSLDPYIYNSSYPTAVPTGIEIENGITNYYNIRWRGITTQCNAGIDMKFLKNIISATVDVYRSSTKDDLSYYNHGLRGDYTRVYNNSAEVENRGVEVALGAVPFQKKDMRWDIDFTFAYNHNKIVDNGSTDGSDLFAAGIGTWNDAAFIINVGRIGQSVGSFYGFKTQGIVTPDHVLMTPPFKGTRLEAGDIKFIDTDGNGVVDDNDKTIIGNPNPKFVVGFNSGFRYKSFSVNMTLNGAFKFDVANIGLLEDIYASGNTANVTPKVYKEVYPNGGQPRLNAEGIREIGSRLIEDGSFMRLSDLTFGYDLDLAKTKWIKSLGFTFSAKNLFVITNYSGYNPDTNCYGYDLNHMGIDNGNYPSYRTFLFGVSATF